MTSELVPWRGHNVPVLTGEIERGMSFSAWAGMYRDAWQGSGVTPVQTTYGTRAQEPVANNFEGYVQGLLYTNGPVAAAQAYRLRVFGQAPLLYQEVRDGRPGDFFDDAQLDLLRKPWPGGTLSDLAKRALLHSDMAGNAFVVEIDGELALLRPDWVQIVLERRMSQGVHVGWRQVGIAYSENGIYSTDASADVAVFLPGEYAHYVSCMPDPLATYRGMSWLTPIIREVMADKAASEHKLKYFENAATPNLVVKTPAVMSPEQFKSFVEKMKGQHEGVTNAYKTLYLGDGADASVIGANMQQMDFSGVAGKGETRIANAAAVPPVLLSFSEGMQGSSLNAGNYQAAKRSFVDTTMRDLWQNWCGSLQAMGVFAPPKAKSRLWYDARDIPFLHEDQRDAAEILQTQVATIGSAIQSGFKPKSAVSAITMGDLKLLEHTGLVSVQLLPPGARDTNGDGQADENDATVAADGQAESDYQSALKASRAEWLEDDSISRARYNIRNPEGSVGGGRFRKLSAVIVQALEGWMNGEGDDDPLEPFEAPQLREAAKQLGLVKDRERVSKPELKKRLLAKATADVHEQKHGTPAPKAVEAKEAPAPKPKAAAKVAGVRAPKATVADARAKLDSAATKDEGRQALAGLTMPQLKELAEGLDLGAEGRTKQDRIESIVKHTVGGRIMHDTIVGAHAPSSPAVAKVKAARTPAGPNVKTKAGRNALLADLIDEELAKDNPALDDTIGGRTASPRELLTGVRDRLRAGEDEDFDRGFQFLHSHIAVRYGDPKDPRGQQIVPAFGRISDKYRALVPEKAPRARKPDTSSPRPPRVIPERVRVELRPEARSVLDSLSDHRNPPSRERAQEMVQGLSTPDLRAIGKDLSIPGSGSMSLIKLRKEIVDATAGRRLDSRAIRGFEGDRPAMPHEIEADVMSARQADRARLVATAAIDVEENAAKGASARAINHRMQAKLKALNIEHTPDGYVWHRPGGDVPLNGGQTGDPDVAAAQRLADLAADVERLTAEGASADQLIAAARQHSAAQGLHPTARAGDVIPFDRATHDLPPGSPKPADGSSVLVVRPGYTLGDVVIERPLVMEDGAQTPSHNYALVSQEQLARQRAAHTDGAKISVQHMEPGDQVQTDDGKWHTIGSLRVRDKTHVVATDESGREIFAVNDYRALPTRKRGPEAHDLSSLNGLTTAEKRAKMRRWGWSDSQIDAVAPL